MPGIRRTLLTLRRAALAGALLAAGCSSMMVGLGGGLTPELERDGIPASAEILEIWDTGWTINDNPVIGMKVRVRPSDRAPYEATIEKTTVSRIAIPQFQPGAVVPVRFDPQNPAVVAVDPAGSAPPPEAATGNPYRDYLVRTEFLGAGFLPPPETPVLFLGTADSAADRQALYESNYALLGAATASAAPDPAAALEAGREIGAALVVVYGRFTPPPGETLDVLPYRPRPAAPGAAPPEPLVSGLGADDQAAAFWGRTRPAILGIVSRPLDAEEQGRLGRADGAVIESVATGSPAAAAGIVQGDVLVALEGEPIADFRALPARITALAGRRVRLELLRGGTSIAVEVDLNPATE